MKKFLPLIVPVCAALSSQAQSCSDVFISEIVEGWSNNKAVEIYNPTPNTIALDEYGLVRFQNGSTSYGAISYLEGVSVEPYDVVVVALDKRDTAGTGLEAPLWDELWEVADVFLNPTYDDGIWPMYFNGNDAIALIKNEGETLVDLFGKIGEGAEFGGWGPYGVDDEGNQLYISEDHTLKRKSSVDQGIVTNPSSFNIEAQWDSLPANTFDQLGFHECVCQVGLNEENQSGSMNVFPSPAKEDLVNLSSDHLFAGYRIMDLTGRVWVNETSISPAFITTANISSLPQGMYVAEIEHVNGTLSRKTFIR
ncbi:MAG: hypothetical protein RL220_494 [Bacteroidota bacterium]|jgi:hypothetical protein